MMSNRVLATFTVMLLFVLQAVFIVAQKEYDGNQNVAFENEQLKGQLSQQRAKTEVAYYELDSYKQKMAVVLPKNIPTQKYQVRNIASLVRDGNSNLSVLSIDLEFKEIKKDYRNKNFEKVQVELQRFIQTYPESAHILEAYYLYVNSLYQLSQYERCVKAIDILVQQYPESEMTGLSLLLMADIFQKQERYDEAKEIYKTIMQNFPYPELQKRASDKYSEINI
jgi:TolA-binding protein